MFVRDYMTKHPVMVGPTMSIVEAQGIMAEAKIRHLPVVEMGKRLVGLITRERLRIAPAQLTSLNIWEISRYLAGLKVRDLMVRAKDVITVDQDMTIEEAARLMVEREVGCLPVLEDGIVVGIITETDLLAQLAEMMATRQAGVRVTMRVPDRKGELAKRVDAINAQGWGITALGGAYAPKEPDQWVAVVKIRLVSKDEVATALAKVEDQEILDIREI